MCAALEEASKSAREDIDASPAQHHAAIWSARATMLSAKIAAHVHQTWADDTRWFYVQTEADRTAMVTVLRGHGEGTATTGAVADLVLLARDRCPARRVLGTVDAATTRPKLQRTITNALNDA